MITDVAQRWDRGEMRWRAEHELFDPHRYEVALIPDDATAKGFVELHHYAHSYPAARERIGLYEAGQLVGVAVFSHPANDKVLARLPCDRLEGVELGRFVLLDGVKFNAESWLIARCFELLRKLGYRGVVSFSDPLPRFAEGLAAPVFRGHVGTIYAASNATYTGLATPRTLRLFRSDGQVLSARAISKVRARERGWRYVVEDLERRGAGPLPEGVGDDERRAWLIRWVATLTRAVRHPGNHTFVFGLDARVKRRLPASLPYPKFDSARVGKVVAA